MLAEKMGGQGAAPGQKYMLLVYNGSDPDGSKSIKLTVPERLNGLCAQGLVTI